MGDLFLEDIKIRPFCDKIRILALKKKKKKNWRHVFREQNVGHNFHG